ncbi:hypothetical protein [Chitinophaga ginsengisoli]|uniref:Uncharacterized protein n=1 Tax=Chitinophaga ginsengisoli TaxID=363837 RepID=A0A2P8G2S7_9BACT|nr:hypothetical protein [Chitinophaga ginsengisoli]PSL28294.1 hypothetical protein CLV42_108213 [Chitinophaga ginsengisoli]
MRSLLFILCTTLAACHAGVQTEQRKDSSATGIVADTLYEDPKGLKDAPADAWEPNTDSLMDIVSTEALSYAGKHLQDGDYQYEFELFPGMYSIKTAMAFGHLFETGKSHLHIRSSAETGNVLDNVYLLENNHFKLISTDTIAYLEFTSDSIGDVNGDKLRDYMVVTYSSSGCCLRYVYNVYTYNASTGGFSHLYNFYNPDFFPEEKVVRGVGYGHPGEVELYKFKWNDTVLETIERIYRDPENDKQFIRMRGEDSGEPSSRNGEVLNAVPKEYRNIDGYEWFMYEE